MDVCCDVCQISSGPSEYDVYHQSEECPLTRDQSTNCRSSSCIWRFRIFTWCLAVMCLVMIAYLIYLHSLLGSSKDFLDHGAVAADNVNCSRLGTDIMKDGGNAVDAAVGAMLCMTVVAPHKTGLGGGGIAIAYGGGDETEPLVVDFATNTISGALASGKIRIPSVVRGLETLHKLKGSLPWSKIVEPAEILAKDGFVITEDFFEEISRVDHGALFGYLEPGELLKLPHLGETLETIKSHGSQSLYNGSLAHKFLRDEFHEVREDFLSALADYEPLEGKARKLHFYDHVIYAPEHAEVLQSVLKGVEHLGISGEDGSSVESQFDVARVMIEMDVKDHNIEQERYTAVIAADASRNFVSILTGLSAPLGLEHMTGAGFLLDGLGGESGNNLHALTPIIFHSSKNPVECSGALGADDPILATEILSNIILKKLNLSIAIETQRYYRLPDGVLMEPSGKYPLDESLSMEISNLKPGSSTDISHYVKSVNAIVKQGHSLSSHSDSRGGGVAFRYK
ncbi:glutathione hydrolase 7-like [Diachasma alloeum]|uniref:glutathione hydrolase 7-like n=1 Tax=Diachasma alloeum TaxID=454923 RepID=UPI000738446B|nr:glutathione hydrolase 7-like [Diachasma alloeum]